MADHMTLAQTVTQQALVLRLTGDLEHGAAARTLLDASCSLPPPSLIVLDLRKLDLLSAAGVHMLEAFAQACQARDVRCRLVYTPHSAVARALTIAVTIPRYEDLTAALAQDAEQPAALEPEAVLGHIEALTRELLGATTVGAALHRIVEAARVVVSGADLVSVTLRAPDGTLHTPTHTHELGAELDQVQYAARQGPCYDAAVPDGPAYAASHDLAAETRWPEFSAAATRGGYRAVLSTELIPAAGPDQPSGALNIYSARPHGITEADRHTALLLATHASLALAAARASEVADLHQRQLRRAVDSRDIIGQAKGILMNRQGITADEAFDLLRRTSQQLNIKVVDLARTLATHHGELDVD
jgi:anti-anti-sigma factor